MEAILKEGSERPPNEDESSSDDEGLVFMCYSNSSEAYLFSPEQVKEAFEKLPIHKQKSVMEKIPLTSVSLVSDTDSLRKEVINLMQFYFKAFVESLPSNVTENIARQMMDDNYEWISDILKNMREEVFDALNLLD